MTIQECCKYVRRLSIEGRHLNQCFVSAEKRAEGWGKMQRARRIVRRLNISEAIIKP